MNEPALDQNALPEEACVHRLLEILGEGLNPTQRGALEMEIKALRDQLDEQYLQLWSDLSNGAVEINVVTRGNRTFTCKGPRF